ncbi:hypothetical protein V4C53_23260 [Paraburkholderia azotifigens]|uniref:hypothetical protein n=1 Tax=Paraburkholderia azotifigens TaxID=2057004 RepID=UPI00317C61F0
MVTTTVSVHAGEYDGYELPCLVGAGTTAIAGTVWQRVASALEQLFPHPPYPRSDCVTVFVNEKASAVDAGAEALRLDIVCRDGLAHTSVQSDKPRIDLEPVYVGMNNDVVAVARTVIDAMCR